MIPSRRKACCTRERPHKDKAVRGSRDQHVEIGCRSAADFVENVVRARDGRDIARRRADVAPPGPEGFLKIQAMRLISILAENRDEE